MTVTLPQSRLDALVSRLNLQADRSGLYKGLSAQFSGDGFSDMRFEVAAIPADQYAAWLESAKAQGGTLERGRCRQWVG